VLGPGGAAAAVPAVSAADFEQSICDVAATAHTQGQAAGDAIKQAAQAFRAEPTQANAIALREITAMMLDRTARVTDQFIAAATAAGSPSTKNGARFAKTFVRLMRTAAARLRYLSTQARAVSIVSATQFAADYLDLVKQIKSAERQLRQSARREPAFRSAPQSLHAIVVYMTTDASACPTG